MGGFLSLLRYISALSLIRSIGALHFRGECRHLLGGACCGHSQKTSLASCLFFFISFFSFPHQVYCGILGRLAQFAEVLTFLRRHEDGHAGNGGRGGGAGPASSAASPGASVDPPRGAAPRPAQVVCGDLNTMSHGIARLAPGYSRGR